MSENGELTAEERAVVERFEAGQAAPESWEMREFRDSEGRFSGDPGWCGDGCIHLTADLTPAQAARLEAIEAALEDHALGAFSGTESACVCDRQWRANREYRHHVALAVAAIDVMRGATDDGAIGRVLALADELERTADSRRVLALDAEAVGASEECVWLRDRADDERAQADRIRAAIGAPATAEGDDRG
jgi:hypothetical protein